MRKTTRMATMTLVLATAMPVTAAPDKPWLFTGKLGIGVAECVAVPVETMKDVMTVGPFSLEYVIVMGTACSEFTGWSVVLKSAVVLS